MDEIPPYPKRAAEREPALPPNIAKEGPSLGLSFGSRWKGAGSPVTFDCRALPPHPGRSLRLPMTPAPPRLDLSIGDAAILELLVQSYRAAVENRTKKRCSAFRDRGSIQRHPKKAQFLAAARLLVEWDIAPAAWAAFACDVWRRFDKPGAPPIGFVFSVGLVTRQKEWFGRRQVDYIGGQVLMGPKVRALCERFELMRLEAMSSYEPTKRVFSRWFPSGLYERMLAEAQDESTRSRAEIKRAVSEGYYPW